MKDPTNEHLRWYLNAKGRLGRWDERMHLLAGSSTRVNAGVKGAIARAYARGLIPSFTLEGQHAPGSYHNEANGVGRAVDLNSRPGRSTNAEVNFQRREFRAWQRGKRRGLTELIGPDNNAIVLRGVHSPLAEGNALENQHDNHVHIAYA